MTTGRNADDVRQSWRVTDEEPDWLYDDDIPDDGKDWRRPRGVFIIAPIEGEVGDWIADIQRRFDPKLAALGKPHISLIGSSGAGPIAPGTNEEMLRSKLEPIAATTAPLSIALGSPHRFMQTTIVSLPTSPHGPLRELHERIKRSGLDFGSVRFAFSPHATLSYFPTLSRDAERELLSLRAPGPITIDRIELSLTNDPQPPTILFGLPLTLAAPSAR